jgi:hypothetical protein
VEDIAEALDLTPQAVHYQLRKRRSDAARPPSDGNCHLGVLGRV